MIGIDANILVYAFDESVKEKSVICKRIFTDAIENSKKLVVTNQVLGEFVQVITRKVKRPLSRTEAAAVIASILENKLIIKHDYTTRTVAAASSASQPFWDALLAQTLLENGVREIYTENVKDFEGSGVKAINPFA